MGIGTAVKTPDRSDLLSAAFLRWFEELADCGIVTTDTELCVRTWNPWLETQTGITATAAIGQSILTIWPSLSDRGFDRYYRDALVGEVRVLSQPLHRHLVPIRRHLPSAGLSEMAQSARIAPLKVGNTVVGTITVIQDVSERVVSERELRSQIVVSEHARLVAEQASSLKEEFLATLSHEIRTPLNAVLGWTRILRNERTERSRRKALAVIERNATAQLRLVEDMLDMGRVMSGKLQLDVKPVTLQAIVQAAIDVVSPAVTGKDLTIHTSLGTKPVTVSADADRLQQAVWNILSNAVKFTQREGQIHIRLETRDDVAVLSIRDNGQGISPDFLPYVFDRFRQADASPGRRHGGLGLGLALVRQIVELHGGAVILESAGENKGTTCSIRLPIARAARHSAKSRRRSNGTTLKGIKVLVVEDNDDARDMLVTALRRYGAKVHAVASSDAAIDVLGRRPGFRPHVLVSDIGMPGRDGYDLIRHIRESTTPALRDLPAIAVTAYARPEDRRRALEAGYQSHVVKPVDPYTVAGSIAELLR